jgi:hypothetical protein
LLAGAQAARGSAHHLCHQTECLDWLLIVGRRQLERVLRIYTQHYNASARIVDLRSSRPKREGSS